MRKYSSYDCSDALQHASKDRSNWTALRLGLQNRRCRKGEYRTNSETAWDGSLPFGQLSLLVIGPLVVSGRILTSVSGHS